MTANVSTFSKKLIKGRFKYRQILVSDIAGQVPTINDLNPGDLAVNLPDNLMYAANDTAVFVLVDPGVDLSIFVTNTYAQNTFVNNSFANENFVWNIGFAADIPSGNNTNRPSPAANGYFRYNTEIESFEGYAAGQWVTIDYAGGSNTWIQFNDSKFFGGSAGLTFDKATNNFFVGNTINSVAYFSGNATANLFANSILLKLANATGIANLQPGLLTIGTSIINTTALAAGANVFFDTTGLKIGNSTANIFSNSILLQVANSTGIANLQATLLAIGVSLVNSLALSVGGSGGMVINSTSYAAGANVLIDATHVFIGNTIANLNFNSILINLANSTSISNLQPGLLTIGSSIVNTTAYAAGANIFLDTTKLSVGNSTANLFANSILFKVANSVATTNVSPDGLIIGTTISNTAGHFGNGAALTTLQSLTQFMAFNSAVRTDVTGDGTAANVTFDTELSDAGGNFAASQYTAPSTGKYTFSGAIVFVGVVNTHLIVIELVTTARMYHVANFNGIVNVSGVCVWPWSVSVVDMTATDIAYVKVTASGNTKIIDFYGASNVELYTFFCGYRTA